ncbi:MAG: serine/threonine protein kinase [Deltaproteobacteria bacterium]|nr:MAG: serine/threonine protein kinase [Deltaproteobacteria bacterium]
MARPPAPGTGDGSNPVADTAWLERSGLRLVRTLGSGGMASVYLVAHERTGRTAALKVLHVPGARLRERLAREARVLQALDHDHIVRLLTVLSLDRGVPGLLMEHVPGMPLSALLRRHTLTVDQVDVLARQVMAGVACAHLQRIVHRDIKPDNILVTVREGSLSVKVADFGIARVVDESVGLLTRTGGLLGTPPYMAPEQLEDPRATGLPADVYSLGVLFYEMATGRLPVVGTSPLKLLQAALAGDHPPVHVLRPDLPARIHQAIEAALSPDPADRPPDAGALLAAWTAGTPPPEPRWPAALLHDLEQSAAGPREPSALNTPGALGAAPVSGPSSATLATFALGGRGGDAHRGPAGSATGDPAMPSPAPGSTPTEAARARAPGRGFIAVASLFAVILVGGLSRVAPRPGGADGKGAENDASHALDGVPPTIDATDLLPGSATFARLTYNPVDRPIGGAAISPDGATVLLDDDGNLVRVDLRSQQRSPVELPDGHSLAGSFGPCGADRIAATLSADSDPSGLPDVWLGDIGGHRWTRALEAADFRACSWDGRWLAALQPHGLALLDRRDPGARPRIVARGGFISSAALSPGGDRIAFLRVSEEDTTLELVPVTGEAPPTVLSRNIVHGSLAWAADGRIFLLRPRAEEHDDRWADLVVTRLVGQGEALAPMRLLSPRVGPAAEDLSTSQDGRRLVLATIDRARTVMIAERGLVGDTRTAATPVSEDAAPAFASGWLDETRLTWSVARGPRMEPRTFDVTTGRSAPLFPEPVDAFGVTKVPGASGATLIQRQDPDTDHSELLWRDAEGERRLRQWPGTDYLHRRLTRCAPTGRCLFAEPGLSSISLFDVARDGLTALVELPVDGLRPYGWDLSPDGRAIAWRAPEGVRIHDLETGRSRALPQTEAVQEVMWTPDGSSLLATAIGVGAQDFALVMVDPRAGGVEVLREDFGWMSHLAPSPDGRRLAWTRTTYDIIAWLVEFDDTPGPGLVE